MVDPPPEKIAALVLQFHEASEVAFSCDLECFIDQKACADVATALEALARRVAQSIDQVPMHKIDWGAEHEPEPTLEETVLVALKQARAEGFAAGVEAAAQWHDGEADRIRDMPQWDGDDGKYIDAIGQHEECSSSIRALIPAPQRAGEEKSDG